MTDRYTSGDYLEQNQSWHAEDSAWKAAQIARMIETHRLAPASVAELGCGAGEILIELSRLDALKNARIEGYDISPQAIALCQAHGVERAKFYCEDLLRDAHTETFDLMLVIDVFEHVPDYLGFLEKCRPKADYKIYHIPLGIHVSSVLRNAFLQSRYTVGHLHYFSAESALAALRDTGHEIVDYFYTDVALGVFRQHPSLKRAAANIPRWLFSKISVPLTARILGGYSLLALTK
ncbi:MAG: methyltransferase domain-containing protein [bacterium]|nr:methyltransferase domain-containing protein [bacterium]